MPAPQGTYLGYNFSGSGSYVKIPRDVTLEPSTFMTIEFRIRINTIVSGMPFTTGYVVNKGLTGSADLGWNVNFVRSSQVIIFSLKEATDATRRTVTTSVSTWNTHDLHSVAMVYDGAHILIYLDGSFVTQTVATGAIQNDTAQDLNFGAFGSGSANPTTANVPAFIDEIRLWDTARDATEISTNQWTELTGSESGLIGYWKFNESSGTTAVDSTTNTNDGTRTATARRLALNYEPTALVANFSAPNADVFNGQHQIVDSVTATFTVPNPTIVLGTVTVQPTASVATFSAQSPAFVGDIIFPTPVIANFSAETSRIVLTQKPTPAIANFTVSAGTIRLTQYATPSVITLSIPPPTIAMTIYPNAAIATFSANGVKTNLVIYPDPNTATFSANGIMFSHVIYPDPATIIFSVSDPNVTNTPTVFITINFVVKIFNVINYQVSIEQS